MKHMPVKKFKGPQKSGKDSQYQEDRYSINLIGSLKYISFLYYPLGNSTTLPCCDLIKLKLRYVFFDRKMLFSCPLPLWCFFLRSHRKGSFHLIPSFSFSELESGILWPAFCLSKVALEFYCSVCDIPDSSTCKSVYQILT